MEEEILEIMEQLEPSSKMICDSFEDDLRAGSFTFHRAQHGGGGKGSLLLPQVYTVLFNETDRTMTWRYPQHRVLTSLSATPIPLGHQSDDEEEEEDQGHEVTQEGNNSKIPKTKKTPSSSSAPKVRT